ncbi:phage tail protein, partial [Klebsiella pneumoniae]
MKKPHALREYLLNAIPALPQDPDRLLIFANEGKLMSTAANGYSFEMAYTLDMIITDYAGDVDVFGVVLFTWIMDNQSELMANLDKVK